MKTVEEIIADLDNNGAMMAKNFTKDFSGRENAVATPLQVLQQSHKQLAGSLADLAHHVKHGKGGKGSGVSTPELITHYIDSSVGDLNLVVTRLTAAIIGTNGLPAPLPYILFAPNEVSSQFNASLSGFIPRIPTLSYSVATDAATGNIIITWVTTAPAASDVITISNSGLTNYSTFLGGMAQNFFKTKYAQYTITDGSALGYNKQQYNQMVSFGALGALGKKDVNQILPNSRRMSWDFQPDIVNMLFGGTEITVVPEYSFVQNIIGVANTQIGWNFYMSARVNLNQHHT